jgi:hypothetical protein
VNRPTYRALLLRRTYKDLALPGAVMDLANAWLRGTDARWDGENYTWRFPSGASLTFGYADGPRDHYRYQGAAFHFCGFDELTQFDEAPYIYLNSRLRRVGGDTTPIRMRGATNPGGTGHDWVKARFIDGPEDRVFIPATHEDNPTLDHEAYRRRLAALDSVTRAQLERGEWIKDPGGLVYRFNYDTNRVKRLPEHGAPWQFVLALDFGWTDETAFVVLAFREHDPAIYVVSAEKRAGMTVSAVADHIREIDAACGGFAWIVGDPASKQFVETLRREHYLPVTDAAKTDKVGHIRMLNDDLESGKLLALEGTSDPLIAEWRGLRWRNEKHVDEHAGDPNHCADACLYAWRSIRRGHRLDAAEPAKVPPQGTAAHDEWFDRAMRERIEQRRSEENEQRSLLYG